MPIHMPIETLASTPTPRRMRQTYLRYLVFLLITLAVATVIWALFFRPVTHRDTVTIGRGNIESDVSALGTLQPHNYVDVGAQASGAIRRLHVQAGDRVKKGQLLVEIDPSVQQAKVDVDRSALARLRAQRESAQAQRTLARQRDAREQQMQVEGSGRAEDQQTARANFLSAAANVADIVAQISGAQSTLNGDEAQLGYTRIYAPMDGTVVTLDAREGQTLNATYQTPVILRIADLSTMTVWTQVSEADIVRVKTGMPVYFTTLGMDGKRWQSRVRQILPAPPHAAKSDDSAQAGTSAPDSGKVVLYTVLFDISNPDGLLMSTMSAQVFFVEAQARDVITAPLSAMTLHGARTDATGNPRDTAANATADTPEDRHASVYDASVLVDGRAVKREVRIGVQDRVNAEVLSGLTVGDKLITQVRVTRAVDGKFEW